MNSTLDFPPTPHATKWDSPREAERVRRLLLAAVQFVAAAVLWIILLGWIVHIWSILDAAFFKAPVS